MDIFGFVSCLFVCFAFKDVGQRQRQNEWISYEGLIINKNRLEIKFNLDKLKLR